MWLNSDLTICFVDTTKDIHFNSESRYIYIYTDEGFFRHYMYTSPLPTSLPLFLEQRTFRPESYAFLSLEYLGI